MRETCFMFDMQTTVRTFSRERVNAGRSNAARRAMMAMRTSNSTRVNAEGPGRFTEGNEDNEGGRKSKVQGPKSKVCGRQFFTSIRAFTACQQGHRNQGMPGGCGW